MSVTDEHDIITFVRSDTAIAGADISKFISDRRTFLIQIKNGKDKKILFDLQKEVRLDGDRPNGNQKHP